MCRSAWPEGCNAFQILQKRVGDIVSNNELIRMIVRCFNKINTGFASNVRASSGQAAGSPKMLPDTGTKPIRQDLFNHTMRI